MAAKKRNANGDGTLRQRADGRWEYRVVIGTGLDGKPIRKSFYGDKQTDAKKGYREWLKNPKSVLIEKVKTVGEWAAHWLEIYKKDKVSYGTYKNYKLYVEKHIVPSLGTLKLDQVKPAHIQKFYKDKADLSASALHHIHIAVVDIFETAIDNGFCQSNPAKKADWGKKIRSSVDVFTEKEIKSILEFAQEYADGYYVTILLYTGMRMGELLALQWSDIDYDNQVIKITRSLARGEEGYVIKGTKTDKERYIAISPNLQSVLDYIPHNGLFVMTSESGNHLTQDGYIWRYKKFFSALNEYAAKSGAIEPVRLLSPHKCRHTFATYMLKGGANIRIVQELLGHSAIGTTEIYTHVDTGDLKNNVTKLGY